MRADFKFCRVHHVRRIVTACLAVFASVHSINAADLGPAREPAPPANFDLAKTEAQKAIKKFRVAPGFKVELVANEPQLENPVAFHIGNDGKIYVSETARYRSSAVDIRHHMSWYDDDLAARTVDDRIALIKKHAGDEWPKMQTETETIRLLEDKDGDGVAEFSGVFADGFTNILDGIASGVMSKDGWVYFTDIPSVWRLRDNDGDGKADEREQLAYGFGVHFSLTGHDLHGLIKGPDGRIYFSVGDRGAHVKTKEGNVIDLPDEGAVFRMEPDGANLEVFAHGLRNPQELAFNKYGDLFTGDNDCDHGDRERWVHVVEGADYGWRIGYQFSEQNPGGVWMSERIWWTNFPGRVAAHLPPLAHIDNGPSGLTYYPGTGLPAQYDDSFFLCHFKGQDSVSGIKQIKQVLKGASYEVTGQPELIWNTLPTDVEFGPDGALYFSDWVEGWPKSMKGRIYRLAPEKKDPRSAGVQKLLAEGMKNRSINELAKLLESPDMRVRLEAQWELANRKEFEALRKVAFESKDPIARLHGIWGVGQMFRAIPADENVEELTALLPLANDPDPEIRGQALAMLGEAGYVNAFNSLKKALKDPNPRVRRFAALGISYFLRTGQDDMRVDKEDVKKRWDKNTEETEFILTFNEINDFVEQGRDDLVLRHRASILTADMISFVRRMFSNGSEPFFNEWLNALTKYPNANGRMAFLLALCELGDANVASFLNDADPLLVVEAARAINDAAIVEAMPALASLLGSDALLPSSELTAAMSGKDYVDIVLRPVMRRSLNANFRVGDAGNAKQLAEFAANGITFGGPEEARAVIEDARAEALLMLGQWADPSPRDKVLGLYRPLASRDPKPAAAALLAEFDMLLAAKSTAVQVAALNAAAELELLSVSPKLAALVNNLHAEGKVRAAALKALAKMKAPEFEAAREVANADFDPAVRKAAVLLASMSTSGAAAPQLAELLKNGSIEEQQTALAALSQIPGTVADEIIYGVLRPWVEAGALDPALELDVLEASRARSDERIIKNLGDYEAALPADDKLAAFHWAMAGGNAENGKKVFVEHPAAACYRCHAVDGGGGKVGPAVDGIATRVTPEYLLESIVNPNASIAAGFENQLIEMNDGSYYAGIIKKETDTEILLNSPEDGILTLDKSEVKSRSRGASGMPEGLSDILTKQDLRDIMAFLQSQK